ncbi:hypothetical protein DO97_06135 [Neosynechococcus sphagnicola sy1]|uniref:Uncharacterized protein n=1 Tax=Neosynechococcus sphagnicola sy1 TaxID=1497020 RepID=A0A098TNT2_9CYAN|nr:hypothetical protein [Neosynechococcus sphagnicola]KGF73921.1 hypothetical protein DO97_06135 [Neosynechococcus sphagnicola sy1]
MYNSESFTQLTFHYVNGEKEAFQVYLPEDATEADLNVQEQVQRFLDQRWWIFHLPDETVCIQAETVLKVDIRPAVLAYRDGMVFPDAQRVSALNRMHSVRVG